MIDRITEQPFCQTRVSGSTFVNADCFDVFPFIEDKSIDAIICDLPYGTTNCKWDSVLDLNKLWEQYERILKENGVVILFAQTPFDNAPLAEYVICKDIKSSAFNCKLPELILVKFKLPSGIVTKKEDGVPFIINVAV